jgi:hypothetical protein
MTSPLRRHALTLHRLDVERGRRAFGAVKPRNLAAAVIGAKSVAYRKMFSIHKVSRM